MFVTRKIVEWKRDGAFELLLTSDHHLDSPHSDHELIRAEMERWPDARCAMNGDLFDLILPRDAKRYMPSAVHPKILGRDDPLDAAVELAADVLAPFAARIDLIGYGNHEKAAERYHSTDAVRRLLTELAARGVEHRICYGGYTGFLDYRIDFGGKSRARLVVYYHHGSGGSAPVTKGMIDFNRKAAWVDSDVVWLGHKHNRLLDVTPVRVRCPDKGWEITADPQVFVMTGGYLDMHSGRTDDGTGRAGTYPEDAGLAPQRKGGALLYAYPSADRSSVGEIKVLM